MIEPNVAIVKNARRPGVELPSKMSKRDFFRIRANISDG
jgi:hypothetical protein